MFHTPTTSGVARKPTTPSSATSPSTVLDAARTFIKRPETKRRSIDNMDMYRKKLQEYTEQPSDKLLQEVMKIFEDIPSKVQQYPQMRKDIKTFLEANSDRGIRILFELSKRLKNLEAAAQRTAVPTPTVPSLPSVPSENEGKVLERLGEVEDSITARLKQVETYLDKTVAKLDSRNNDRAELTINSMDKITEGVVGRAQAHLGDLVSTVAGNVTEAKTLLTKMAEGMTTEINLAPRTYASAVAAKPGRRPALHSMAVTCEGSLETADEVLARVKQAVDARATGLKVSKARKAKNQTVILGCETETEMNKVRERLESHGKGLNVEPMRNKDPLVVLKDVFMESDDDGIIEALQAQNTDIFMGLQQEEMGLTIKYKKRTKNPNASHVVLQVRPKIWQRMTEAGALYLDLQRVRVEDQSPLIQCTKCLAFGHGRKFCTESVDKCSHCGGPHLRDKCAEYTAGSEPQCCNCLHSKLQNTEHNAFSGECPTRKKWDYLARANTAYQ